MSTKTLRKRIALVSVAALMGGLLSVTATPVANAIPADRNNLTAVGTGSVTSTATDVAVALIATAVGAPPAKF